LQPKPLCGVFFERESKTSANQLDKPKNICVGAFLLYWVKSRVKIVGWPKIGAK